MARCNFCGNDIEKGTGMIFVQKTGKVLYFCSRKCEKNLKLGRTPRYTRWTQEFKKHKGKLTVAAEKEALQLEAGQTGESAVGKKPKLSISTAAAKKLKG